ncbi:SRPBCC family protein [Massilia cavernae]|nr:SRPBCC family protein [Massilia cavernae]
MRVLTDKNIEWSKWLTGAAAGALLMYIFDPERGAPRRAYTAEKMRELTKESGDALERVVRKIGEGPSYGSTVREYGSDLADQAADTGGKLASQATDALHTAEASLRSTMHRATEAASDAMSPLLEATRGSWTPAARSAAVVGGGVFGLYALARRSPLAIVAGLAGLALLARGASNRPLRSLVGSRQGRVVEVSSSIRIDASPEQVYELWSHYENFPRFMSNVSEVRDLGDRRSHWVVKGPGGVEYKFNSVLTEQSRPHRLAWRSEPGEGIEQSGSVDFQPSRGGTRVTVHMSYVPPEAAAGYSLASAPGSDWEHQLDEDLARMKAYVERGTLPSAGARQEEPAHGRFLH